MEEESPLPAQWGRVCLLPVNISISHYSGSSARAGGPGTSAVALYDYQGGKSEAT